MSAVFDHVQEALMGLGHAENLTDGQKQVCKALSAIVAAWHEENHKLGDRINLKTPSKVRDALKEALDPLHPIYGDPRDTSVDRSLSIVRCIACGLNARSP